jgi:hypothetical protein
MDRQMAVYEAGGDFGEETERFDSPQFLIDQTIIIMTMQPADVNVMATAQLPSALP